jgi:cytochrome b561
VTSRSLTRYGAVAQTFHWLTAVLVLVAFVFGPGGSEQRVYSASAQFDRQLHETLGLSVLGLVIVRLLWRMVDTRPEPPAVTRWMDLTSKAVHWALYLLLFALPITAITGAWLEGHPLTFLGGVELAPLLGTRHKLGQSIATVHTWLGDVIMWLAGVHGAAALYHHVILKDGVLASMLPRWFRLRRPQ